MPKISPDLTSTSIENGLALEFVFATDIRNEDWSMPGSAR